jgi:hypothetical protein
VKQIIQRLKDGWPPVWALIKRYPWYFPLQYFWYWLSLTGKSYFDDAGVEFWGFGVYILGFMGTIITLIYVTTLEIEKEKKK